MVNADPLLKRLTDLIQPLVEDVGLELVEISLRKEQKRHILGIIIDKTDGVTVEDCAELSRQVSLVLDVEDPIPYRYDLEVGSPGIFRELKSEKEIFKHLNSRVKVVFHASVKGRKQFIGTLTGFEEGTVRISTDGIELAVELDRIKKIQLFPDV